MPRPAKTFCATLGGKCVVKADGLALGKGVLICANQAEAEKAVDEIMVSKAFGAAGANVVIQEFLEGIEVSLHALCDGRTAKIFPTSQDHKRALDGDLGLNTGGMGTYSPTPFLTDAQLAEVAAKVLEPFMRGCVAEGIDYRGLLVSRRDADQERPEDFGIQRPLRRPGNAGLSDAAGKRFGRIARRQRRAARSARWN